MAKWAKLVGVIPQEPSYDERIDARLNELRGTPIKVLAAQVNLAKEEQAKIRKEEKAATFEVEVLERAMVRALEDAGMDSTVCEGYRWTPSPEPYPKVTDREALRQYVAEHMPEVLSVQSQTLASLTKARLEAGEALLPGTDVFLKISLSRTKSA